MSETSTVVVVKGGDHTLRARAVDEAVTRLLGDDDRTLALAEFTLPPGRGSEGEEGGTEARRAVLGAALDAARTPPFGTARRVVVVRSDDGVNVGEADLLVEYLASPEPTTALVLEAPGRLPADLSKALKGADAEEVGGGGSRDLTGDVLTARLTATGITLSADAQRLVRERLGEEAGRIPALVDLLESTYGRGARLGPDDVSPYLGDEGAVPVFELTKALDAGDTPGALALLDRFLGPMGMHPLQVMAILHNHYRRILRVDDPSIRSKEEAHAVLGGHQYPAGLAWQRARDLGTEGVRRIFDVLAEADLDLRGRTGAPDRAVMEILVARLARMGRRSPARRR